MSWLKSFLTDPAKRPQLVIWIGVLTVSAVVLIAVSLVGTSTNWFCTGPCHTVHDDNTAQFNQSSHVMLSCISCHEPVNASPITFIFKKIEVAPDLFPTMFGTFKLPMNENEAIAFETPDKQCTQCHDLKNRKVTPSAGLIMNHTIHTENGVNCTMCHNRIAHPEDNVKLALAGDKKHEDWMSMDACFRCHGLQEGAKATGKCSACHPADFNLVPASHTAPNWYQALGDSKGHAAAYSEEASRVVAAQTRIAGLKPVKTEGKLKPGYEQTVNTCYTCHQKQFCTDCHGVEMPHPADFATNHAKAGTQNPAVCANCHARSSVEAQGTNFCSACHHPSGSPDRSWLAQHFEAVRATGAQPCFDCHNPRYCSACHVEGPAAAAKVMQEQVSP